MTYRTWVLSYDFSEASRAALAFAEHNAAAMGAERLHLVHGFGLGERATAVAEADLSRIRSAVADRIAEVVQPALDRVAERGGMEVTREVVVEPPARAVTRAAEGREDAIIIAGLPDGGLERALPGVTTQRILRSSHVPILAIPKQTPSKRPTSVVVAVDLSARSAAAVEAACRLFGADELTVLSLIEPGPLEHLGQAFFKEHETEAERERRVREILERTQASEATVHVAKKAPAGRAILEVADLLDTDAIVLGTSGHGAVHRAFLGSAAGRVLAETRRPTLFVPSGKAAGWL